MPPAKSDTHETPNRVYEMIASTWGYTKDDMFDPCPVNYQQDGLSGVWKPVTYVNPPYTLLKEFVVKAIEESQAGNTTIMLLPAKTDQQWFHDIIDNGYEIVWIRKRLKFKNNKWSATQPHFLVMIK